uniref:CRAL-TRIO domain-containing protein n=1 Tax=Eucampia antarctica TaxID=49252 RepID=A0A7S2WMH5_9STRA|mmetsp:Transcript_6538/g.6141  ORF Transcript_6538/g.6141 Transcript_6538/m.6141 type:complete len:305 (+) Transcript_6538:143-1057(+)|eukprot:CAMPEP_0197836012 /NCGR_PEP_ID=MMETSP1437-20131217/27661_1 /TAXON_ID=49252 ORGANISM="Eucampia antarctica, Strain CCMP1452" /NCGR_SAMPLE_ID=MMETSP1437 /ASSEMBLY_ACC=CAM_ASM_001096 /LENGTH=304 /DNA_ID=CAMNT_0043441857 /DNA_START=115 /DNA_END=1029 /DNA_ORIENTATION=+
MSFFPLISSLALALCYIATANGFSSFTPSAPVTELLQSYGDSIDVLKKKAQSISPSDAPEDNVFYLRYCLEFENEEDRLSILESNMQWRTTEGKTICDAARSAVEKATTEGWKNDPVREMAPYASIINKYITPSQSITTASRQGDLVYCIRAGKIDDVALMSDVSAEQMSEFLIYCREVLSQVANSRSAQTDRLVKIVTANDLYGVKLIGGDARFRKALGEASTKSSELYPALSGPTLLLNLPRLLGALVKLFTPLFPEKVRQKLKFENGPLKDISDLAVIGSSNLEAPERKDLLDHLDRLLYN